MRSSDAMDPIADLAERFGHNEVRVNYTQNPVPGRMRRWPISRRFTTCYKAGLATGNNELLSDIICCPGLDYCNLATARLIPIAKEIAKRFEDPARQDLIGKLRLNMLWAASTPAAITTLAISAFSASTRRAPSWYQITLGGSPKDDAAVGSSSHPRNSLRNGCLAGDDTAFCQINENAADVAPEEAFFVPLVIMPRQGDGQPGTFDAEADGAPSPSGSKIPRGRT